MMIWLLSLFDRFWFRPLPPNLLQPTTIYEAHIYHTKTGDVEDVHASASTIADGDDARAMFLMILLGWLGYGEKRGIVIALNIGGRQVSLLQLLTAGQQK